MSNFVLLEINETFYSFGFVLDCLRSFTDLEELDETELYYCHKCKKRQKSTKKFWVQKLPKVEEQKLLIIFFFFYYYNLLI